MQFSMPPEVVKSLLVADASDGPQKEARRCASVVLLDDVRLMKSTFAVDMRRSG